MQLSARESAGLLLVEVMEDRIDAAGAIQFKDAMRELAATHGYDLAASYAYSDSMTDLPMLEAAGLGIAFHAKPKVKATASQSISTIGLDGVLYFLGLKDSWIE